MKKAEGLGRGGEGRWRLAEEAKCTGPCEGLGCEPMDAAQCAERRALSATEHREGGLCRCGWMEQQGWVGAVRHGEEGEAAAALRMRWICGSIRMKQMGSVRRRWRSAAIAIATKKPLSRSPAGRGRNEGWFRVLGFTRF